MPSVSPIAGAALGMIAGSLLTAALLPSRSKEERRTDALRGKVIVFFTAGTSSKREVRIFLFLLMRSFTETNNEHLLSARRYTSVLRKWACGP